MMHWNSWVQIPSILEYGALLSSNFGEQTTTCVPHSSRIYPHSRGWRQELTLYLLQLVQALKFESTSYDPRASRSAATAISHEDSGLADFLIERAVQNPVLGNRFHWYLMVEVEDKVTGKMFGRVAYKFQEQISKVSKRTFFCAYVIF